MAPEQLEGKEADARTDIFALGCVLYEMATGQKAFEGTSQASLIGAICATSRRRSRASSRSRRAPLDRVVATCLAKAPDDRWQTARDVALQLEWIRRDSSEPGARAAPLPPGRRRVALLPWLVAAGALALAAIAAIWGRREPPRPRLVKSFLLPPPGLTFHVYGANVTGVAVSSDGRRIAFGAREPDGDQNLWIRDLGAPDSYRVPGGEGALFPFWSPDSRSIGFFAKGKLRIVEASASPPPPRDLADVAEARGGSWGEDGTILYATSNLSPLLRVAASGGTPSPATRLDVAAREISHRWPQFLPGGRRFLYEIRRRRRQEALPLSGRRRSSSDRSTAWRNAGSSPRTRAQRSLLRGYLLFRRANNLMVAPCDPKTIALRGDPVALSDSVQGFSATGASDLRRLARPARLFASGWPLRPRRWSGSIAPVGSSRRSASPVRPSRSDSLPTAARS